VKLSVNVDLE